MWTWIVDNVTFDRVVGILSLIASLFALIAAQTARSVAKTTQEQIRTVRFSEEVSKLRISAEALRRAVRNENWDHALERCDDLLSKAAELGEKFDEADRMVRGTKSTRFSIDIRNIAATCEAGVLEENGGELDRAKVSRNVDKQIEVLSKIYGNAQQEMEVEIVKR